MVGSDPVKGTVGCACKEFSGLSECRLSNHCEPSGGRVRGGIQPITYNEHGCLFYNGGSTTRSTTILCSFFNYYGTTKTSFHA